MQKTKDGSGSKRRFEPWNSSTLFIQRNSQAPGAAHSTRVSRGIKSAHSSRAIIDATRPYEWHDKISQGEQRKPGLKDKVATNWRDFLEKRLLGK